MKNRHQGVGDTIVPLFRFRASVVIAPLQPLQWNISKKRNFREDTMAQFTQRSDADAVDARLPERASGFTRRRCFGPEAETLAAATWNFPVLRGALPI